MNPDTQARALRYAYSRFQASGLGGVRELDALLATTRGAARLLRACAK